MIKTDTKQRYIDAIKDIRTVMLGPCPVRVVGILANEGVPTFLRRWTLQGNFIHADIHTDFQAILSGLDKIINIHPMEPCLRVMRGRALMALGWYVAAIEDFERAVLAKLDIVDLYLFLAETYFAHAKKTSHSPLSCYTMAAIHASKAITLDSKNSRAYLCRAQTDAHIMKHCAYHHDAAQFSKKYKDIQADLQEARRCLEHEEEQSFVDAVDDNIDALLGIDRQ